MKSMRDRNAFALKVKELKDVYKTVPSDHLRMQLTRMEDEAQIAAVKAVLDERQNGLR